jgi:hypothetical protein
LSKRQDCVFQLIFQFDAVQSESISEAKSSLESEFPEYVVVEDAQ